jgi:hypothetical protein
MQVNVNRERERASAGEHWEPTKKGRAWWHGGGGGDEECIERQRIKMHHRPKVCRKLTWNCLLNKGILSHEPRAKSQRLGLAGLTDILAYNLHLSLME